MGGFGSNISALQAQRRLSEVSTSLSRSFERLSTGQRINRASDDAAGLAIADQLRVNSRLYLGGVRNVNDALSMLNIADGTLDNQTQILIRLKELAEQSANGVYTAAQRETQMREYNALVKEYGRLGDTAKFNGISLLRSQGATTTVQAGVNGRSSSVLSISSAETGSMSGIIDLDVNPDNGSFYTGTANQMFSQYGSHMVRFTVIDSAGRSHEIAAGFKVADTGGGGYQNKLRVDLFAKSSELGPPGTLLAVGYAINAGDEWSLVGGGHLAYDLNTGRVSGDRDVEDTLPITMNFNVSATVTAEFNLDVTALRAVSSSATGLQQSALDFTGMETVGRARDALTILDRKLSEITGIRGQYGALQSRLQSSAAVLESSQVNSAAAESRIRDVDVASEAARLTALQILQQTASSVLASANQQPSLLLRLLQGG